MRRNRRRSQIAPIDQINVNPLLDLMFLLLIVFMLTMPLMEYGTAIQAPEMNSSKLPEKDFKSVTLTKDGTIMIDKRAVTKDELTRILIEAKAANPKTNVLLRSDGERQYNEVIDLMKSIRHAGFDDVSLVTQAERK